MAYNVMALYVELVVYEFRKERFMLETNSAEKIVFEEVQLEEILILEESILPGGAICGAVCFGGATCGAGCIKV